VAVITRAIDFLAMPASFLGATLGAVITAVVTLLLLRGQAQAAEETERNVRIFELKKVVFTEYINKVWTIWSDQHIDDNEFETLCSFYYKDISMYLKDSQTRQNFVDCLIDIGKCLGKETEENYKTIKNNVFEIINILIKDLELGGSVDKEQHEHLAKMLFPGFFKKAIEKEIFNELQKRGNCFLEGQYESVYFDDNEYLCFYFDTVKSAGVNFAKIIIGPFKSSGADTGQIEFNFYTELNGDWWRPDNNENMPALAHYKTAGSGWGRRIIKTKETIKHDISRPIDNEDKGQDYILNFNNMTELENKYLPNYQKVAKVLAERVGKVIDQEKINEIDIELKPTGKTLSIIEFMQRQKLIE
jgi:hypothetical protein